MALLSRARQDGSLKIEKLDMWVDPIIEEVQRTRKQLLARAKGDISTIINDALARQKKGRRKVLAATPRQPEQLLPKARKRQAAQRRP